MDLIERTKTLLKKHEGVRCGVYKDSLGNPTIGVGLLMSRLDTRERLEKLGVNYDKALIGKAFLSDEQIEKLLEEDVQMCFEDLRKLFPDFDERPADFQLVLCDIRFNIGGKGLRGFPNTLKDLRAGNYSSAANRLEASLWAKQVRSRAVTLIKMLRAIPDGKLREAGHELVEGKVEVACDGPCDAGRCSDGAPCRKASPQR